MKEYSVSSTSKILMNDWTGLREILGEITLTRREAKQTEESEVIDLLTDINFQDGFQGPLSTWIKELSKAYILLSRVRTQIVLKNDDNIKPYVSDRSMDLPDLKNPDINAAAVDKLQLQLDELAREQLKAWQTQFNDWQQQFVMQLMMHDVPLSELEIEAFSYLETVSELLEQFTELNLTLPKFKGEHYEFADYFKLKVILAVHSAWGRVHKAHEPNDINKLIKSCKDDFKQIQQQEQELLSEQKRAIWELVVV